MNGRPHDDIERLVRDVQQFEPYEEEKRIPLWRGLIPLIFAAWVLVGVVGYCIYRAYEALPT